jgi:hypothetical protein
LSLPRSIARAGVNLLRLHVQILSERRKAAAVLLQEAGEIGALR